MEVYGMAACEMAAYGMDFVFFVVFYTLESIVMYWKYVVEVKSNIRKYLTVRIYCSVNQEEEKAVLENRLDLNDH